MSRPAAPGMAEAAPMLVQAGGRLFLIPRGTAPYLRVGGPLSRAVLALLGGRDRGAVLDDLAAAGEPSSAGALLSAAEALIARHALAGLPERSPPRRSGAVLLVAGSVLALAAIVLCTGFLIAQVAPSGETGTPLSLATLGWLALAVPVLVVAHEAAHLLVARLFAVRPSAIGLHRGRAGLPMPWLDLREAWNLAPRDHALVHLAGPFCDLLLTALALLLLWVGAAPVAPLQALALAGSALLLANLTPFGRSDLVGACRAARADPDYGPCRLRRGRLAGPPGLKRFARLYLAVLALAPALLCLATLSRILR
ncbi:hypothetical protein [Stappia sp. TSB10GB4]|uniref:hypothetical protein n=1 Tax=Stappia sp. TSB10GB4 TaxID=2003584 RepID=UPI0016449780|nr:hypothetical protein [Stappia sp. TSB10GB4]